MVKIIKVDRNNPDEKILNMAVEVLRRGGLVAFPTETVYGLELML
jgi:translation factor SUA5